jgi:hypothetical protein
MVPNFASLTNASAKVFKKNQKLIFLKIYSKRKILTVFEKLDTKIYMTTLKGGIMFCKDCEQTISTTDIVNQSLKRWKGTVIQVIRAQDNRPDTIIPLSPARLDMAAYTFSYHMNGGCALELDPFRGNNCFCKTLLKYRFEEHSASHSASCF